MKINQFRHVEAKIDTRTGLLYQLFLCTALLLTGCAMVGPDYKGVQPDVPVVWHTQLQGGLQTGQIDPATLANWWKTLNDPILEDLEEQAVKGSLNLQTAKARVREARAQRSSSKAGLFPSLNGSGSVNRYQTSKNNLGSGAENTVYDIGFDAGWEIDLFGGVRRSVEAADATLAASREDLNDVLVSLMAEVALNYVDVRTYQARLTAAKTSLVAQQKSYDLNLSSYKAGLINQLAVKQAEYNLERTQSLVPSLEIGLESAKNRLAVLLGKHPGTLHEQLAEYHQIPAIPISMTIGIPAETLRHRPDIRRAEYNLAAQTAKIGVATADLYPKFRLMGTVGLESISSSNLFQSASRAWSIGPGISWNLFDGNAIRKNIEVQTARQEQAMVAYESAILHAQEEVENALTAYAKEQLRQDFLTRSTVAAQLVIDLADDQFNAGLVNYNVVLDARRSFQSLEDELAVSRGKVTSNMIRLYKALGGGWVPENDIQ
ncbi:MAG: efflux transporter outer membrane subunit [Pseudomonadota bacterium]